MGRIARVMGLAALCAIAGAGHAHAQTYYLGVRGGYNHPHDSEVRANGLSGLEAGLDASGAAAAAFGFEWVDGWRFEGEFSWRRSDFDSLEDVAVGDGRAEIYATMLNVYYGLRKDAVVNPYLGGGFGGARLAVENFGTGAATVDDFGVNVAWQAMAGVDFSLSASLKLSLEYRYFAVDEVKLIDSTQVPFKMDYQASIAMLGLRVGF